MKPTKPIKPINHLKQPVKQLKQPEKRFDYVVPSITRDYYVLVMVTLSSLPPGMYGMDEKRAELHAKLCEYYELPIDVTKQVTDNMDKIEFASAGLHSALCDLRESRLNKKNNKKGLNKAKEG